MKNDGVIKIVGISSGIFILIIILIISVAFYYQFFYKLYIRYPVGITLEEVKKRNPKIRNKIDGPLLSSEFSKYDEYRIPKRDLMEDEYVLIIQDRDCSSYLYLYFDKNNRVIYRKVFLS